MASTPTEVPLVQNNQTGWFQHCQCAACHHALNQLGEDLMRRAALNKEHPFNEMYQCQNCMHFHNVASCFDGLSLLQVRDNFVVACYCKT